MANEINISLTSKSTPTINLQVGEEAKKIVETNASAPVITFIATGEKGEQGVAGTANINDNSVTSNQIADGTITSAQIANGTISTEDIGTQQITSAKLSNSVITTQKIANDAITGQKIADNSISANHIVNGTIVQELITDLSLTGGKLQNNSIDVTKLVNNTITAAKIANKTLTGAEIEDNVVLGGQVTVTSIFIQGSSPGYINGPASDDLIIRSNDDLIFQLDYDQASQANTSNYRFKNGSGTDLMVLAESGDLNLSGNIQLTGNIILDGTVDGVDIANTLAPVQASLSKLPYITVTQGVNLDTMESDIATNNAKTGITTNQANAITANTAKPDLTVDGAGTVHSNNYTDTVYTHPTSHPISLITGLQTALNAKQDAIGSEDLTIQQTDGLQDALDAKVDDSQVLTNVPANAVFTDTVYTHPANHAISVITGLQAALDGKVNDSQVLTNVPANAVFTDTNTTYSIQDGELSQNNFTDADHTKLNNIEPNATADQTKADIDALGIAATTAVSLTAGNKTIDGDLLLGGNDGDSHYIIRQPHTNNDGGRLYVQAGTGGGTNKAGGSLFLNAGKGTGTAGGGSVIFESSVPGSSGSLVNNPAVTAILNSSGTLFLEGGLTVKGDIIKSNAGTVFTFDASANTTIANTLNATLTGNVTGDVTGNADTATALTSGDKTIEGNLRLGGTGDTSNNWISIDAQNGNDSSGGGITFYETGTYDVDSPQYGAKIVYNEDADEFAIGTMHNNVFMRQIYFSRQLARTYFNGDLQIRDSSPSITVVDTSTTVANGDVVGILNFSNEDDDGSTLRIQAVATEDHASGTNGGTKLEIKTTPNGSSAEAVALTVGEDKSLTSPGLLTSMQRHVMRCGFFGSASRMYLPFNYGGTFENTSTSGYSEYGAVIMPCDGYVESVIIRSENACANSNVTILVASNGTEVPTLSSGSFLSPTVNMAAEDTSYKFTGFVNQGGTSNSFSAGDVIMIAFDPTNSSQDTTATAVLVFDWNNQL